MIRRVWVVFSIVFTACAEGQSTPEGDGAMVSDVKVALDADRTLDVSTTPDVVIVPMDGALGDVAPPLDAPTPSNDATGVDAPASPDVTPPADLPVSPVDVRPAIVCGDGIIDQAAGEVCDDGNTADGDACAIDCRRVLCAAGARQYVEPGTQTCYWRDPSVVSRTLALTRCTDAGATLAMFETEQELNAVYPSMALGGANRVWIGLQRGAMSWAWDNGIALAHMGFRAGEPSGDGTCAEWGPANNFNDIGCGNSRDFVCERIRPGRAR